VFRVTADTNVYIAGLMTAGINRKVRPKRHKSFVGQAAKVASTMIDEAAKTPVKDDLA
jgi:hypothetical protein